MIDKIDIGHIDKDTGKIDYVPGYSEGAKEEKPEAPLSAVLNPARKRDTATQPEVTKETHVLKFPPNGKENIFRNEKALRGRVDGILTAAKIAKDAVAIRVNTMSRTITLEERTATIPLATLQKIREIRNV